MKHLLPFLLLLASCSKESLKGSGDTITESRNLSPFSRIEATGSEEVEVLWAPDRRVEVTGYRNLVAEYDTEVRGSTLRLRFDDDVWNVRRNNIHVRVYTPALDELQASGSGDVEVLANNALNLRSVEATGSGNISISQPAVDDLTLRVTGSGKIAARDAAAKRVDAKTTGSGAIETTAVDVLHAEITGSGDIRYWGTPRVTSEITGSGRVQSN